MWNLRSLLFIVLMEAVCGFYFQENYSHVYKYQATSDMIGMHNVTTVVQFRVQSVNTSLSHGHSHVLYIDSFVQFTEQGYYQENPKRWDLSKAFLFQVLPSGLVDLIHVHREDQDEVVTLKKVLASTFSANVRVDFEGDTVSYKSNEMDHTGVLTHDYEIQRTPAGMIVRRRHTSNEHVERRHDKDLYYHPDGTLQHFSAVDTVTLSGPPNTISRKPLHGEKVIKETLSGEFPDISSTSITQMNLLHKSRNQLPPDQVSSRDFIQDKLLVKKKANQPIRINDVRTNITKLVQCVHSFENKHAPNRTECVYELRNIMSRLHHVDLREIGKEILQRRCSEEEKRCQDEKHLFLDIIARIGSVTSQLLVSHYVLEHPLATQEEIERTLVHCIAITQPELVTLESVEKLCFGHNDSLHGGNELQQTQRKACLAIGSLAKSAKNGKYSKYSEKLVEKLENWLKLHNETESAPILSRTKRDLLDHDVYQEHHIVSKMVLLHSIGNAGLQRSFSHLTSYMEPNVGTSQWRRAAIFGLRHFSCQDSSTALLRSSIHDNNDIVREEAYTIFQNHPLKENFTKEHINIILSKSYTYPTIMRMRRGVINDILKKISFRLRLPGMDWRKVLGTSKIGASFGVTVQNGMELQLRTQSGFFKVDIYDEAFAEGHIGLLHINIDIFRAKICFRGHIKYKLNILKEYGINDVEDVIHIFDKMLDKLVTPVRKGIEDFKDIINLFKKKGALGIIEELVETVRKLPTVMNDILPKVTSFLQKILRINGLAWVEDIKHLVLRVRSLIQDVVQDILSFYHSVVDAATVTLPHMGRQMWDSINKIVEAIKHIFKSPVQTYSVITKQIERIKTALKEGINAKNQIVQATFFAKGTTPYWMVMKKDIIGIYNEAKSIINSITSHFKYANSTSEALFTPEDHEKRRREWLLMQGVTEELWAIMGPLNNIKDIATPFIRSFKGIVHIIKSTKKAYEITKKMVDFGMSQIKKTFGKKFHRDFPTERRPETEQCGAGVYPTTSGGQFKTKGLDILLDYGSNVVNPMNGVVTIRRDNEILIEPSAPGFYGYEIIVANVKPTEKIIEETNKGGIYMVSGDLLGHAIHSKCKPNSIHVAVRKSLQDESSKDDDYTYLDPGVYLDRQLPMPHWIQECNDYKFTHIGQVFDSHSAAKKAKKITKAYKRAMFKRMKEFKNKKPDPEPPYRPRGFDQEQARSFTEDFRRNMMAAKSLVMDFFKQSGENTKSHRTIGNILSLLQGKSNSTTSGILLNIVAEFNEAKRNIPAMPANAYTVTQLQNLLSGFGLSSQSGDHLSLIGQVRKLPGLVCSGMRNVLPSGLGHICLPDRDCLGLTCNAELNFHGVQASTEVRLRYDSCTSQFYITAGNTTAMAADKTINIDVEWPKGFLKPAATISVHLHQTASVLLVNVSAKVCIRGRFHVCSPNIGILTDVQFEKPAKNCTKVTYELPVIDEEMKSMTLEELIDAATELNVNQTELLKIGDSLREAVSEMLQENSVIQSKAQDVFEEEIPAASTDICCNGNIPIKPIDITFFSVNFVFMIGPVPLSLGFGAGGSLGLNMRVGVCFLSLSTQSTITPWVGAKVWGSFGIDIGFARGGIKLIGYLMEVQFPLAAKITFSQFPIAVTASMDVDLVPLRLELNAYVELFLLITTVTVYRGNLWSYKMEAIKINIFKVTTKKATGSKPMISALPSAKRSRRSSSIPEEGCQIQQIANRNPKNPAYQLEVFAQNDFSQVKTIYAIGDHAGGSNVADWTEMSEYSVFVPVLLPGGIPLYWTVKVTNSENLEAVTSCKLNTYDSSVPDGRFDPSYPFTSRPDTLRGAVIIIDDTPLLVDGRIAIGYGPGDQGVQVMPWKGLKLQKTHERPDEKSELKFFTAPKPGKLTKPSFKSLVTQNSKECSQKCVETGPKCLSFDYETATSICDMNDVIEGSGVLRRQSGSYSHFQRLGTTYMTYIDFDHLNLRHGTPYYINVAVENELGYKNTLPSVPILPDFTPPEPGPVGNSTRDVIFADGCQAAFNQRCIDVIDTPNHRKIIDGFGASTIFNGHQVGSDQLYTISTDHITANWNGFEDKESGIWGYTWAVGQTPCSSDTVPFSEPMTNMGNVDRLQTSGFASDLHLSDGLYYITMQALNNVVLGGAMVTTVCHSQALTVDTSPPKFDSIESFIFDEDFDTLTIFYSAKDDLSLVAKVDFGLGKTKHDSMVRPYSTFPSELNRRQKIVVENLALTSGTTAWIRLRVYNNVGLYTSGHGDVPLLKDDTPPNAGVVYDGKDIENEAEFQSDESEICAHWDLFTDEQTGINRYRWAVGSQVGLEDIVPFRELSHGTKKACASLPPSLLRHNMTYYSTVIAFNNALNSQSTRASSNGVLLDTTPPVASWAKDGSDPLRDMSFGSDPAKVSCTWGAFSDQESSIDHYEVAMFVNEVQLKSMLIGNETQFEDNSVNLKCGAKIRFRITGFNKAGLSNVTFTNGFLLDCTPPKLKSIRVSKNGLHYQARNDFLDVECNFMDMESGMSEYRIEILEEFQGQKQHFWPTNQTYHVIDLKGVTDARVSIPVRNLELQIGAKYHVEVVALNEAELSTSVNSDGVLVDMTPPILKNIHIGLDEEEELADDGSIILDDPSHVVVSWTSRDPESGITRALAAIGTSPDENDAGFGSVTGGYVEVSSSSSSATSSVTFNSVTLNVTSETGDVYYVSVVTYNGAGLASAKIVSRPITVLEANVPGILYDGTSMLSDRDFSTDKTTVSFSFDGFRSKACNIVSYEWGVGTRPYFSDLRPFSTHGLSMDNVTVGHGQTHVQFSNGQRYYVTVRALTGPRCRDKYILSTSNGLTIDSAKPTLDIEDCTSGHLMCFADSPYFVRDMDSLNFVWSSKDRESGVKTNFWFSGSLPEKDDVKTKTETKDLFIPKSTLKDVEQTGSTVFISVGAVDNAGNKEILTSNSITVDNTKPEVKDFVCSDAVSKFQTTVKCSWSAIEEAESLLGETTFAIGTRNNIYDLLQPTPVFADQKLWEFNIADQLDAGDLREASMLYVTLNTTNILSMTGTLTRRVNIDRTPPRVDDINIITSTEVRKANQTLVEVPRCQDTNNYLEISIDGISDEESLIVKVDVVVSSSHTQGYLTMLTLTKISPTLIISDIYAPDGATLSATITVSNSARLHTQTTRSVIVSANPKLTVEDGALTENIDFQTDLSTLQAHWTLSGHCPVVQAEWSIKDIVGKVVKEFKPVSTDGFVFSDEFSLENGHTYISIIRVTDALNRTLTARSDGVTVMIQPPDPGQVRDGLVGEDNNYQLSSTELSANWDEFGDRLSDASTQKIDHYEVAVGTSRIDARSRHNVHDFVDVGGNTSYMFTNLNLTAKTVSYYITVRGCSEAGSFSEVYSDGIQVGFSSEIIIGRVEYATIQSSTHQIEVSWKGFLSDIGMKRYLVGVSDRTPDIHHHTQIFNVGKNNNNNNGSVSNVPVECSEIYSKQSTFNVKPLKHVGLDTYVALKNMSLRHGGAYFVTVIAEDVTGHCEAVTGEAVKVDTTPPDVGVVVVNDVSSTSIVYATETGRLHVSWHSFEDIESNIGKYDITLVAEISSECDESHSASSEAGVYHRRHNDNVIDLMSVSNVTEADFYHLDLTETEVYYVHVMAFNGVGLNSSISSVPVKIDRTPPLLGSVKAGSDWTTEMTFQATTTDMSGVFSLATDQNSYECPQEQSVIKEDKLIDSWLPLDAGDGYATSEISIHHDEIQLAIRYDDSLVHLLKSGFRSELMPLLPGNYTSVIRALAGNKMVTSIALAPNIAIGPQTFELPQDKLSAYEDDLTNDIILDAQDYSLSNGTTNATYVILSGVKDPNNNNNNNNNNNEISYSSKEKNEAKTNVTRQRDPNIYGIGYDIIGYTESGSTIWYCLFWATDKNREKQEWIDLGFDPTASNNEYIISLAKEESVTQETTFTAKFLINGQLKISYSGLSFLSQIHSYVYVKNMEAYRPPITDPFNTFSAHAVISDFRIPIDTKKLCKYGSAFFDGDSGIHEIWLGASDKATAEVSQVMPYKLHSRFCKPCVSPCTIGCNRNCSNTDRQRNGFQVIHYSLTDLNLTPSSFRSQPNGTLPSPSSPGESNDLVLYYLQVKIVNYAGQETVGVSKGTMVDLTPPRFQSVTCIDPSYSMDEPSDCQGTTESVGAYWECEEDVGEIVDYTMGVGTKPGITDVYLEKEKDLSKKDQRDLRKKRALPGLKHLIQTKHTYFVVVIATNNAGLKANMSCNITIDTEPPVVKNISSKPVGAYKSFSEGEPASLLEDSNHIEISWSGGPKQIAFYEWEIGSSAGQSDIFPRIKIGTGRSKKVSLINGQLILDGASANQSMSISMMAKRNWTDDQSVEETKKSSVFQMEPGRCLHYSLYAVSKSHLAAPIDLPPTCITRKTDIIDSFSTTMVRTIDLDDGSKSAKNGHHGVKLKLEGIEGRIMAGSLTAKDLQTGFGSAASVSFKSFISDPMTSKKQTSRFMSGRIQEFLNSSFYMAPAPVAKMSKPLSVELKFDAGKHFGKNQPTLLFWDTDSQTWGNVEENCYRDPNIDMVTGTYRAKICPFNSLHVYEDENQSRSRRSARTSSFKAIQYSLVSASPFINTPPIILIDNILVTEDKSLTVEIKYQDKQNDSVFLTITTAPSLGKAVIVNKTFLLYKPDKNAYGTDSLVVNVKEQSNRLYPSLESSKKISVNITSENDSPDILFMLTNGQEMRVNTKQNISVSLEGNSTDYHMGNIILTDVDYNETFYWKFLTTVLPSRFLKITQVPISNRNSVTEEVRLAKTIANYSLTVSLPQNITGQFGFRFVASDHKHILTSITQILTLDLWVFVNPCIHGRCEVNPNIQVSCNSKSRIDSFEEFVCKCDDGYRGQWCSEKKLDTEVTWEEITAYCLSAIFGLLLLGIVMYFCLRKKFVRNKVIPVRRFSESLERQSIVQCMTNNPMTSEAEVKSQLHNTASASDCTSALADGHDRGDIVNSLCPNMATTTAMREVDTNDHLMGRLVTILEGGDSVTTAAAAAGGGVTVVVKQGEEVVKSDSGQPDQHPVILERSVSELTEVST